MFVVIIHYTIVPGCLALRIIYEFQINMGVSMVYSGCGYGRRWDSLAPTSLARPEG